jgi:transposase
MRTGVQTRQMVRPNLEPWGQSLADLRQLSVEAAHPRTRERFQALYMIGSQQTNATHWAATIGRELDTVLSWVHRYNEQGPDALVYQRSGGRTPLFVRRP